MFRFVFQYHLFAKSDLDLSIDFFCICSHELQCLKKEIPTAKELDLRPLGKVIIFRHTGGVTTDLLDVRFAQEYAQSIARVLICV